MARKEQLRIEMALRVARFPYMRMIEAFDFKAHPLQQLMCEGGGAASAKSIGAAPLDLQNSTTNCWAGPWSN